MSYKSLKINKMKILLSMIVMMLISICFSIRTNTLAWYTYPDTIKYFDEDRNQRFLVNYSTMTSSVTELTEGWYYVGSNITIDGNLLLKNTKQDSNEPANINIVIRDSATLTINGSVLQTGFLNSNSSILSVYTQENNTGSLVVNGSNSTEESDIDPTYGIPGLYASEFNLYGGYATILSKKESTSSISSSGINAYNGTVRIYNSNLTVSGCNTGILGYNYGIVAKKDVLVKNSIINASTGAGLYGNAIKAIDGDIKIHNSTVEAESLVIEDASNNTKAISSGRDILLSCNPTIIAGASASTASSVIFDTDWVTTLGNNKYVKITSYEHSKGEHHDEVAATCYPGSIEYWDCVNCRAKLDDELNVLSSITIAALDNAHTFDADWSSTPTAHYHASNCGHTTVKNNEGLHIWNSETGVCSTCGYTCLHTNEVGDNCSVCGKNIHIHTYSNEWSKDSIKHWYEATCSHDIKREEGNHTWNEETGSCSTCGYACLHANEVGDNCSVCGKYLHGISSISISNYPMYYKIYKGNAIPVYLDGTVADISDLIITSSDFDKYQIESISVESYINRGSMNYYTLVRIIPKKGYTFNNDIIMNLEAGVYSYTSNIVLDSNDVIAIKEAFGNDYGIEAGDILLACNATKIQFTYGNKTLNTNNNDNVTVKSETGFSDSIILNVEVTNEKSLKKEDKAYSKYLNKNESVGVIYDIKLYDSSIEEDIQPSDIEEGTNISIIIQFPENVDYTKITKILHVHSETDIEEIEFDSSKVNSDGTYEISNITKLSEFVFVYESNRLDTRVILGICFGSIVLLLCMLYLIGYLFYYRVGKMDNSKIKVLYKFLPKK